MSSATSKNPVTDSNRRTLIGRALYRCIRTKGYAQTQLRDIAQQADMTPSHVRYYFDGKQAILEWYFARTCEIFAQRSQQLLDSKPDNPLDALAQSYFPDSPRRRAHLQVFVELRALALHNESLNQQVKEHDRQQIKRCGELLAPLCTAAATHAIAEIAYALAQGLYMAEALERFDTQASRGYFQQTMQAAISSVGTASN